MAVRVLTIIPGEGAVMFLPPIPPWEGVHPIIIHFPIALLLVAPVLIVLGLIYRDQARGFFYSALILMIIGTLGAYLAVASGEATAEVAERPAELMQDMVQFNAMNVVLAEHSEMGETVRWVFTLLTLVYAGILLGPMFLKKNIPIRVIFVIQIVFLLLYGGCSLLVAQTGHLGGRLVHQYGLRAPVNPGPDVPAIKGD